MTDPFANQGRRKGFQAPISNDTPVAEDKMAFDSPHDATADIKKYHSSLEQIFAG
jgi:epoxyqueuosine reductase